MVVGNYYLNCNSELYCIPALLCSSSWAHNETISMQANERFPSRNDCRIIDNIYHDDTDKVFSKYIRLNGNK